MKKAILFIVMVAYGVTISSQTIGKTLNSTKLRDSRNLKINLPKNYDSNSDIKHPLILVLDGDYLFEPVVGQVAFQTYFDEMPQAIVVGICHDGKRNYDGYVDKVTGFPVEMGAKFYEFIGQEVVPYMERNYNISSFKIIVGQDYMGNFSNAFMFKEEPMFQAYINISPDYIGEMASNLKTQLNWLKKDIFFYMSTATQDIKSIRKSVLDVNETLKTIDNRHFTYYFDDFQGMDHSTMVTSAISKALNRVFDIYTPLEKKELEEKALAHDGALSEYVEERYERIEDMFGIDKDITEKEFQMIMELAEEREDSETLKGIGKMAEKQDPNSVLGTYYQALSAKMEGKNKKAYKLFESAFALEETEYVTKETLEKCLEELDEVLITKSEDDDESEEEKSIAAEVEEIKN